MKKGKFTLFSIFSAASAISLFAFDGNAPEKNFDAPPAEVQRKREVVPAPEKSCPVDGMLDDCDMPPPPPPGAFSKEEARLLRSLFTMSDAELQRLRGFISHLEKMPRERRLQMAEDLDRASADMSPDQRKIYLKEVRKRFRKNQENLLARYYSTLSPEQADSERKKFLALDPKEQREYLSNVRKKLGYAPLPPPRERDDERHHKDKKAPKPEHAEDLPAVPASANED